MATDNKRKTAIVIGAGVGGISTATRLAAAGFDVTVLEKNSFTGGRCSLIHTPEGYRFDQGPSLLLLPHLFHSTFHDLNTSLEAEGVTLLKCEPNYLVHTHDGEHVRLSSDLAIMKHEIEKWEGKRGYERYLGFLRESHRHYELSVEHVLLKNFTGVQDMLRWDFLKNLLALHPFESIWTRAGQYFRTERLRRVFTFGSMYMGMSPFDAPGTYSLLQYTELAEGIWYPVGGFYRVMEALQKVGEKIGVKYRMETAVKKIILNADGSRALGVELEDGEKVYADVVVNNSDLVYAYNELLPHTDYADSLKQRPGSCSSISFYWGLNTKVPALEAHNIFLAKEYKESFDSIFKKHLIPDEPSFYVNVPSRVDASAAPEGKDTVVVLVPVGHLLDSPDAPSNPSSGTAPTPTQDWEKMISVARTKILTTIASRTGTDLTPLIVHEQTNSPLTWQSAFNLDKGAILGLSHSFFNVLCFRPTTRARRPGPLDKPLKSMGVLGRIVEVLADAVRSPEQRNVKGLYFVGASAHPGTGVPIVLAGGKLVAEQVLRDEGMVVPWQERRKSEKIVSAQWGEEGYIEDEDRHPLDVAEEDTWWAWFLMTALPVLAVLFGWGLLAFEIVESGWWYG